jgi:soluble lytic murein transglycosylase-like protein
MIFTGPTEASCPPLVPKYTKAASELAARVARLKDKYWLEYKDTEDLMETCQIIVNYTPYTHFSKNDVATLIMKESRFNHRAVNRKDGGRGLGQLTRIKEWHKDTLFWMTDPFDKRQNILGILTVLEDNLKRYKSHRLAITRYNGFHQRADEYAQDFFRKKSILVDS